MSRQACNRPALERIGRRVSAMLSRLPIGRRHQCVFCGSRLRGFLPYRGGNKQQPALMSVLQVVGSDLDNFSCPVCGAHDRERHLLMYMRTLGILDGMDGARILHFAPEPHLSQIIRASGPSQYVQADLFPARPGIEKVDIAAMSFETGVFDWVIANHVLEHVHDVGRALSEVRRVLAANGHAILQTPYSARLKATWDDNGIDDPQSRLQAFGQEDHVRLFGRDIFDRIVAAGFVSQVATHAGVLADSDAGYFGVNDREPFFLFEKTSN